MKIFLIMLMLSLTSCNIEESSDKALGPQAMSAKINSRYTVDGVNFVEFIDSAGHHCIFVKYMGHSAEISCQGH